MKQLQEISKPVKIISSEGFSELVRTFHKELGLKPVEITSRLNEKKEKKTFASIEKKFSQQTDKEKLEQLRKTIALFELGEGRCRPLFLLSTLKTFNLTLFHNVRDIHLFFEPSQNAFSVALAIAKEISFYLRVALKDPILLEGTSSRSQQNKDLQLLLSIFKEVVKFFVFRLRYKEDHEQSKEFKNTYIIETIFLLLENVRKNRLKPRMCPVLFEELVEVSEVLFQLVSSLFGSFDFLIKLILERILEGSLDDATYIRILNFALDSCFQNESRKKFLGLIKSTMVDKKNRDQGVCTNELIVHYGTDTMANLVLILKEKYHVTNNALEYIIFRSTLIWDSELRTAVVGLLNTLSQFGEYSIISCATRFIIHRVEKECKTLEEGGRATRELKNTIEILANITSNPYFKSILLAEEAIKYLNPVLKGLLRNEVKESEAPVLKLYANLLNARVSVNNLPITSKKNENTSFVDPISREHVRELAKICAENLFLPSELDGNLEDEYWRLKTQVGILNCLCYFFDGNYDQSLYSEEFTRGDDSVLYTFARSLQNLLARGQNSKNLAGYQAEIEGLVLNYFRMINSVAFPAVLTKETFKSGKRVRKLAFLLGNTRSEDKKFKDAFLPLTEDLVKYFNNMFPRSSMGIQISLLHTAFWDQVNKKEDVLQSLYKSCPLLEEKSMKIVHGHYEATFEKTYDAEWQAEKVPSGQEVLRDLILSMKELPAVLQVRFDTRAVPSSNPSLEVFIETSRALQEESRLPSRIPDPRYVTTSFFPALAQAKIVYIGNGAKKAEPKGAFKSSISASPNTIIAQSNGALPAFAVRKAKPEDAKQKPHQIAPELQHQNSSERSFVLTEAKPLDSLTRTASGGTTVTQMANMMPQTMMDPYAMMGNGMMHSHTQQMYMGNHHYMPMMSHGNQPPEILEAFNRNFQDYHNNPAIYTQPTAHAAMGYSHSPQHMAGMVYPGQMHTPQPGYFPDPYAQNQMYGYVQPNYPVAYPNNPAVGRQPDNRKPVAYFPNKGVEDNRR